MILVGISNATHRTRDLTISEITEKYGNSFPEENGQAENFTAFLEEELFPFIDQKYPVTTYRTLIGHSYGGLFTLNTLVKHPDLFTNYLAIDPSLDWDAQKLLKESKVKLAQNNYAGKKSVYVLKWPIRHAKSQHKPGKCHAGYDQFYGIRQV